MMQTPRFSKKTYSVKLRLIAFVALAVLLVSSISIMSAAGLHSTYHSLSNLRERSLSQMFLSMTLGVKITQISTYANRLRETVRALEYQEASAQLASHLQQVHQYLEEGRQYGEVEQSQFADIIHSLELLENSVQDLLQQTHQRHVLNTTIISKLNQSLLYLEHIKRLEKRSASALPEISHHTAASAAASPFSQIQTLIETATKGSFSFETFIAIRSVFNFLPEQKQPDIQQEWQKIEQEFAHIIQAAYQLEAINQRIQFLTFQIDFLVAKIDGDYSRLAQDKIIQVNENSKQIQTALSKQIVLILLTALFTIALICILGGYIYHLFGNRLYSITQALTRLSQGDKAIQVPQQQRQDEIGELARAFYIFQQNVLKLDHADALLKEKSELLERTFFAMRDGLAIFNPQDELISYNRQFIELLHLDTEQIAMNFSQLAAFLQQQQGSIYGSGQVLNEDALREIRSEQEPLEIDYKQQILEWRISALQDGGLVAFLIDRTQRKKLELDLAHSQKMRSIGHLTGGIAHDFNNLLAVIIGNLDLIDAGSLSEKQRKRLQRALKAAENSATLTQRLLAYARKQPLNPSALDINRLLLEFSDFMKHSLPPSIKLNLHLDEYLPPVYMDKNQLETALVNLLLNAKDALNGEGEILIRTQERLIQRTHKSEQMIQLSISDNGCGMDSDTLSHIFEPFFTTKQNGKGSGLGLSMVYGFIRQSKGRVEVESALGIGTSIHLQLPIAAQAPHLAAQSLKEQAAEEKTAALLLIEDQAELRETLQEQLNQSGYRTISVENAEQALAYLQHCHSPPDYILSDIVLNGKMTGIDLANQLKSEMPSIKILLMTGNHTRYISQLSEFALINKPFKQEDLLIRLRRL